jgi:hypothetical protein
MFIGTVKPKDVTPTIKLIYGQLSAVRVSGSCAGCTVFPLCAITTSNAAFHISSGTSTKYPYSAITGLGSPAYSNSELILEL